MQNELLLFINFQTLLSAATGATTTTTMANGPMSHLSTRDDHVATTVRGDNGGGLSGSVKVKNKKI